MHEFIYHITGGLSLAYYAAAFFFSSLAIFLSMWVGSAKRNVNSSSTPREYSFRFLIWDNGKRIMAGLISMFLLYRFASSIIGKALSMEAALGVGFFLSIGTDQVIGWLKQHFELLRMNREKIMRSIGDK